MSGGSGRYVNPDSDYQTTTEAGRATPFGSFEQNGGSRRGGMPDELLMETWKRSDPTNALEFSGDYGPSGSESLAGAFGNPDIYGPGPKLVATERALPGTKKARPVPPNGVYRQE